jgi:predicted transcriptional regulator
MTNNTLVISVLDPEEAMQQMLADARQLDQGTALAEPNKLVFSSLDQLLSNLSTKRWELVNRLAKEGALSIKKLSELIKRDYSNVHSDVQRLRENGLIETAEDGKVYVPWDNLDIKVSLKRAA